MQFTFHKNSGEENLTIDGDLHKYLFKVRRTSKDKNIYFRNLSDDFIYEYKIILIDKKKTQLSLVHKTEKIVKNDKYLHIGWCIVDPKTIEKTITTLNEMGVDKISFIYCTYSQKQFKINFDKLDRLLINSSQQCGRSTMMVLESYKNLEEFLNDYPQSYMFNFSNNFISEYVNDIKTIIVGCEGGFANNEISKIDKTKVVGIKNNLIMRSETAASTLAAKILF